MLGKIFACITLSSTVYAMATGRIAALSAAILGGAADAEGGGLRHRSLLGDGTAQREGQID